MTPEVRTHDLLRLRSPEALRFDAPAPTWILPVLREVPWVVVRRGVIRDGWIPIGLRGRARSDRCAAFASSAEVVERLSPEDLLRLRRPTRDLLPFTALAKIAPVLRARGRPWGPCGGVGFEIATGERVVTPMSDLDVVLRQDQRLDPGDAATLLDRLRELAAPTRVDVMLESPHGGVALSDLAANPGRVLLRTVEGSRLCTDPWSSAQ